MVDEIEQRRIAARIRVLANVSVMRGGGFACLAVVMAMSGLAFDPALSFRFGAVAMLLVAVVMQFMAMTCHRLKRVSDSEVWAMLDEADRPPKQDALRMIVAALSAELHEKALWSAAVASGFLGLSVVFRALG